MLVPARVDRPLELLTVEQVCPGARSRSDGVNGASFAGGRRYGQFNFAALGQVERLVGREHSMRDAGTYGTCHAVPSFSAQYTNMSAV